MAFSALHVIQLSFFNRSSLLARLDYFHFFPTSSSSCSCASLSRTLSDNLNLATAVAMSHPIAVRTGEKAEEGKNLFVDLMHI